MLESLKFAHHHPSPAGLPVQCRCPVAFFALSGIRARVATAYNQVSSPVDTDRVDLTGSLGSKD
jgi:hypothetical protein